MSFSLTAPQIRARTKTVTRRLGWAFLKPGDNLQAIVKGQGLKKGERVERLAEIRVLSVRRELLRYISDADVVREGFASGSRLEFIAMFCRTHKGCTPDTVVTVIHFMYARPPAAEDARET